MQQIQSEEFQYPFLDMTDLLIQLCYHFARHFIDGIHYIACEAQESYPLPFHNLLDIALLLEHAQNQLDISEVVTRAENYHCLSTTLFTLKCIEDIFGLQTYKMLIEKLVQENLDIADITSLQSYITDEEDLFFFKAIELLSIKDIFSQSWSNVLDKIRKNFSPIRRYFCSKNAKQAFKMHCKSNVSAAYSFNWKVYCHPLPQKTSLTLEWQIFNRDIYLNEPSTLNIPYAQSPTEPSMGKALSPVLGFVFSSNNCQCKQKHCAANYELRMYPSNNLQNKIECILYQIESLQDFPIMIDTTFYCYIIEYSTNSILVRLTLNDLSLFVPYHSDHIISSNQNFSEGPIYFDISCDFGARGNHPRCFLSWSMQKYYRPTSCTYCGLLEIQR